MPSQGNNVTVFLSKIKGITQSEAYSELLELAGGNIQPAELEYNIDMYASEKCLNSEWLKSEIGISEGKDKAGKHIKIPYKDKSGNNVAVRKRYNPSKSHISNGDKVQSYVYMDCGDCMKKKSI